MIFSLCYTWLGILTVASLLKDIISTETQSDKFMQQGFKLVGRMLLCMPLYCVLWPDMLLLYVIFLYAMFYDEIWSIKQGFDKFMSLFMTDFGEFCLTNDDAFLNETK